MQVSKSIATNLRIGLNRFHNQKTSPFVIIQFITTAIIFLPLFHHFFSFQRKRWDKDIFE